MKQMRVTTTKTEKCRTQIARKESMCNRKKAMSKEEEEGDGSRQAKYCLHSKLIAGGNDDDGDHDDGIAWI